jgi:cellobiose phosphorylase
MDAPVKFSVLKLRNVSGRPRRLSVTGYMEWVLGDLRHKNLLHVQTEVDLKTGALLARNYYNTEFPDRIVFLDVNETTRTLTGDRKEFIGRNGNLAQPAALKRQRLSGKVGAGWILAARASGSLICRMARNAKPVFASALAAARRMCKFSSGAFAGPTPAAPRSKASGLIGTGRSAR